MMFQNEDKLAVLTSYFLTATTYILFGDILFSIAASVAISVIGEIGESRKYNKGWSWERLGINSIGISIFIIQALCGIYLF